MVGIGEAASGPAQHRNAQRLQCVYDVVADAARVGNGAVRADEDAGIDQFAQMLRKMPVQKRIDRSDRLLRNNDQTLYRIHKGMLLNQIDTTEPDPVIWFGGIIARRGGSVKYNHTQKRSLGAESGGSE